MLKHVIQTYSSRGIRNQDLIDEILSTCWNCNWTWIHESIIFDVFIGLFDCVIFEGGFPKQKSVQNNSNWPDINFIGMTIFF